MKIKEVRPINFLFFRTEASLEELKDHIPVGQRLYKEAVTNNFWITGPVQWHYYNFQVNLNTRFELEVALPVRDLPADYDGEFHIKRTEGFKCVSAMHDGTWTDLASVYDNISKFVQQEKLISTNMSREVYVNVDFQDPAANCTEVQFGVL